MYLSLSFCTLYFLACQVTTDSRRRFRSLLLCSVFFVTSVERCLFSLLISRILFDFSLPRDRLCAWPEVHRSYFFWFGRRPSWTINTMPPDQKDDVQCLVMFVPERNPGLRLCETKQTLTTGRLSTSPQPRLRQSSVCGGEL